MEHRDGSSDYRVADLKKSIFSLGDLAGLMRAGCARYLEFIGELEDRSGGPTNLDKISRPVTDRLGAELARVQLFPRARSDGAAGDRARRVSNQRDEQPAAASGAARKEQQTIGRILKRLRLHGLIKKRQDLQVLPDGTGTARGAGGTQTQGTPDRPRVGQRQRINPQICCASCTGFSR